MNLGFAIESCQRAVGCEIRESNPFSGGQHAMDDLQRQLQKETDPAKKADLQARIKRLDEIMHKQGNHGYVITGQP